MDLMDHFARGLADHCGSFLVKYLAFVVTDYFLSSLNYLQISPNSYCRIQVQRKVFSSVELITTRALTSVETSQGMHSRRTQHLTLEEDNLEQSPPNCS